MDVLAAAVTSLGDRTTARAYAEYVLSCRYAPKYCVM